MLAGLPLPEPVQESIIKNRATPGEALAQMAKVVRERLTLILVDNQRRLLEYPPIIEALYMNKHTPMSAATKIIELAARNKLELNLEAYHEMLKALDMDPPLKRTPSTPSSLRQSWIKSSSPWRTPSWPSPMMTMRRLTN